MTYDEVQMLLQMINIDLDEQYALRLFKKCDRSADNRLDHSEIELFCRELLRRPELDAVFLEYSSNGRVLSTVDLREFLKAQGEDNTLVHAQSLILTYELNEWARKNQLMTANGFTMYMLSKENLVFDPDHDRVYQDMNRPLSHYFISSSHNTYLTKDQVMSESSAEPYIRALNHGCRCVELDCWDGDREPVIYHGHTLTSKVPFREVVEAIAEYAFKASPYPLILSLENHCSVEQQAVMAQQLRSILGDKLLTKPLNNHQCDNLPSPEELKWKILVKGKKIRLEHDSSSSSESSCSEDESKAEGKVKAKKESKKVSKLSPELSDLVVYTCSIPFKGFHQTALKPNEISSFSESQALKHIKNTGKLFVRHNSQQLSRIYPSGQRLQSSNYNPQDMWNAGCQIVALNFQTHGEQMDLNQGRFLPNGRCGYVLKPSFLCQPDSEFNPENTGGGPGHNPTLLIIKVISAQQLPKPNTEKLNSIVDPMVWVETHGAPIDNNRKKTHRIDNNGMWDCTFKFLLHVPELVLVRFVVEDHDYTARNEFLGQFTLPFTSMRTVSAFDALEFDDCVFHINFSKKNSHQSDDVAGKEKIQTKKDKGETWAKEGPPDPFKILNSLSEEKQQEIQKALHLFSLGEGPPKSLKEAQRHNFIFWNSQPVPKIGEEVLSHGPIQTEKPNIRQDCYSLPEGFCWETLDLETLEQLEELCTLLNENYTAEDDNTLRFHCSPEFLRWALCPPGWQPEWHCGVRVSSNKKLVGFISAVPATVKIYSTEKKMVEVNFLCVHKKLRSKRMAPVLIREITRRVQQQEIYQAIYRANVVLPTPVTSFRNWYRSLNPRKLIELNFSTLPPHMTLQRVLKLNRLPEMTKTAGLRLMTLADVPKVHNLLSDYLKDFYLLPILNEEETKHLLLPRDGVIDTYVVEGLGGKITDLVSFYTRSSTVLNHPTYRGLKSAHAFYTVTTVTPLKQLMEDVLIIAKSRGFDVFNALEVMRNKSFLEPLKFTQGDNTTHYYLYNWKCPNVTPDKVSALHDVWNEVGPWLVHLVSGMSGLGSSLRAGFVFGLNAEQSESGARDGGRDLNFSKRQGRLV
ncbi:1-phosphatidylinositol 4,5-bisphosphate phosphodiesterase delta-3-A [Bagarius yarrelli]|uniref:Phosphoinositide phospholipase C n=1 Tax=Bagarius yarrelli TaxID=175774 RepID=A0A556TIQ8_BAGYA|nr:1-phosphatidylinositol 4,5-bisphosphate phosphodiesterase delta-3-A [Bagarius yarrelli]